MFYFEAKEITEDLLISLQNHLERAVEEVDKQRTSKRIEALKIILRR